MNHDHPGTHEQTDLSVVFIEPPTWASTAPGAWEELKPPKHQ